MIAKQRFFPICHNRTFTDSSSRGSFHCFVLQHIRCIELFLLIIRKNILQALAILSFTMASLSLTCNVAAEEAPSQIAGIVLGTSVKTYPQLTQSNFMKEVVITDWHGFRKGTISYGACRHIDMILKIDLKYEQEGKAFYSKLLKKFQERFGEPDEWKGDSFGVVLIWKWYFTDRQNNKISLILQHNSKNSNETIGNMVKLSYPDKIAEEQRCFTERCDAARKEAMREEIQEDMKNPDWSSLIPQ